MYGALTGSWLNMLAYRLARGMSVWRPSRSFCDGCGRTVGLLELVPILGWVVLRGRARCCGVRISPVYPLNELAWGLLFCVMLMTLW